MDRRDHDRGEVAVQRPLLELEVLDRVGDLGLAARDADGLQRLVELAAGRADERVARAVLTVAGNLADEHEPGILRALAEDGLGRRLPEFAAAAPPRSFPERLEIEVLGKVIAGVGRQVELRGLEPLTFRLPAERSPS